MRRQWYLREALSTRSGSEGDIDTRSQEGEGCHWIYKVQKELCLLVVLLAVFIMTIVLHWIFFLILIGIVFVTLLSMCFCPGHLSDFF